MSEGFPRKILCLCTENTVRSVMLEALLSRYTDVESAGINPVSFANPLTAEVIRNNQLDFVVSDPKGLGDVSIEAFDLVITVSEPAHDHLKQYASDKTEIEYWVTAIPPVLGEVSREACIASYQNIFDELKLHIQNRFEIKLE